MGLHFTLVLRSLMEIEGNFLSSNDHLVNSALFVLLLAAQLDHCRL